jgi:hypothetical protein
MEQRLLIMQAGLARDYKGGVSIGFCLAEMSYKKSI